MDGILSSGLTALLTNSAAMRVTSNNIANINTPGYVRRDAPQETLTSGGVLNGVRLSDITRVVNDYLDKEVLTAGGAASRYDIQSSLMDQLNAALGAPGDSNSLGARLDAVYASLGQASLDPSSLASRLGALGQFQSLAQSISDLSGAIASLRSSADQQVSSTVSQANTLIQQIAELNPQIQHAIITGDTGTGLLDQRDMLVQQLSQLVGVQTSIQSDGRMFAHVLPVADLYRTLSLPRHRYRSAGSRACSWLALGLEPGRSRSTVSLEGVSLAGASR